MRKSSVRAIGLLLSVCPWLVQAAEFRGQVLDAVTRHPVEAAVVTATNGSNTASDTTDVFGFFDLGDVASGTTTTTVTHPGYVPLLETNVLASTSVVTKVYELTPAFGPEGPGFELFIQVTDAGSGIGLSDVPVGIERYVLAGDTNAADVRVTVTDSNGFAVVRGMRTGFYRFDANLRGTPRPRWLSYTTAGKTNDKQNLMKAHMVNMALEPGPNQVFDVQVRGYDPVVDAEDELLGDVYVELEMFDPANTNAVVLPARTGVTDTNGLVVFNDLPALPMKITAKKMGYLPTVTWIDPAPGTGDLLPNPLEVELDVKPSVAELEILTPYAFPPMMLGIPVRIMGLKGTATEGIFREVGTFDTGTKVAAAAEGLPPGRYKAIASGPVTSPDRFALECMPGTFFTARYRGEIFFEVEGDPVTTVPFPLEVVPATVRLRLFAADDSGTTPVLLEGSDAERPIYKLVEQEDIRLIEDLPDRLFMDLFQTNVVATGPDGEVTFQILPGSYGVAIPSMTNYTGIEAVYVDETVDVTVDLGWPYYDWPVGFGRDLTRHACGLIFDSGHEYRVDLYVRKQVFHVAGDVEGDPANPTTFRILANPVDPNEVAIPYSEIAHDGGSMILTGPGGLGRTNGLTDLVAGAPVGAVARYAFRDLVPGTYSYYLDHPRHTSPTGTFTVTDWEAPGMPPSAEPGTPDYVEALTTRELIPPYTPAYTSSFTATLSVYATNSAGDYELIATDSTLDVVQPKDYAAGKFFSAAGLMPLGTYEFWQEYPPHGWFRRTTSGDAVYDVYINGTSKNVVPGDAPPIPGYTLTFEAQSADDPDLDVTGASVTVAGSTPFSTPETRTSFTNGTTPLSVTHPMWTWTGSSVTEITNLATPAIKTTLWMMRGMGVSGIVTSAGTGLPVEGARVRILDRFGAPLRSETTDSNGVFEVGAAIATFQTVFADIQAGGFLPWRKRLVPDADGAEDDLGFGAALTPVPPPTVGDLAFNRYGLFLPGVRKTGDETLFNDLDADEALTVTWTAKVSQVVLTNEFPRFDLPDGSTGAVDALVLTDRVASAWLVDKRVFPTNAYSDEPISSSVPSSTNGYKLLRGWLLDQNGLVESNRFMRQVPGPGEANGSPNGVDLAGAFKLYNLPIDTFDPCLVVLSERGQVAVYDYTDPPPTNMFGLRGLRLPPWMATLSDVIGVVSATQLTAEELKDVLPTGRFEALPRFTTSIEVIDDGGADGFVLYTYELAVAWTEGMDNLASGLLSLAPGTLGLAFEGAANVAVNGRSGSATFGVNADIKTGDIELNDMLPRALSTYVEPSVKFQIGAESTFSNNITATSPIEFDMMHEVGGGVASVVRANLEPVLGKLPYVGPVLIALNRTDGLKFFGVLEGGVGQESEVTWRTLYPPPNDAQTGSTNLNHVLRRHVLGGEDEVQILRRLCFRYGVGLDIEAGSGLAGASGRLRLVGNECGRQPEPAASVAFNPFGDWPPVTRVSGDVTASVEAFLKAWIVDVGKSWEWELVTFDVQFGTEPVFQLIPMTIKQSRIAPDTATPAQFEGDLATPTVVGGFYPAGSFSVSGGSVPGFAYTQVDPGTTSMIVDVSFRTGEVWSGSSPLVITGGIANLALKEKPGGGWITVWNAVEQTALHDPFADSALYSSTSTVDGAVWSAPALVTNLNGMARELKLVCSGTNLVLVTAVSSRGPLDMDAAVSFRHWQNPGWTLTPGSETNLEVFACAAAGVDRDPDPRVKFLYLNATGALHSLAWTVNGIATNQWLTNGASAVSASSGTNRTVCVAWAGRDGGLHLSVCDTNFAWSHVSPVVSNALASEVDLVVLDDTNGSRSLLTWIEGGDVTDIWYAFLDKTGTVVRAPDNLTRSQTGRYHDVQLAASTGWTARIVSRFTASPSEVREFVVSLDAGGFNDVDGDLFNDLRELVLIDADPADGVTNLYDVLPGDDFDGDGLANRDEFDLGFNATDPTDVLYIDEIETGNTARIWFLTGTALQHRVQSSTNLLAPGAWTPVETLNGDGVMRYVDDTNTPGTIRSYRIAVPRP